jgi:uncharacterized protein YneF (UPF0154 family)
MKISFNGILLLFFISVAILIYCMDSQIKTDFKNNHPIQMDSLKYIYKDRYSRPDSVKLDTVTNILRLYRGNECIVMDLNYKFK